MPKRPSPLAYLAQAALFAAFALAVGAGSVYPEYRQLPADTAVIKLALRHQGQLKEGCRQRTPEELAKLPPNMRAPMECSRGRANVAVRLTLDDQVIYAADIAPGGLAGDGSAYVYQRFTVPTGKHRITAQLSDDGRPDVFGHEKSQEVELRPGQVLVAEFDASHGGFTFH